MPEVPRSAGGSGRSGGLIASRRASGCYSPWAPRERALVVAASCGRRLQRPAASALPGSVHLVCTTLERPPLGATGQTSSWWPLLRHCDRGRAVALLGGSPRPTGPGYLAASVAGALCVVALLGVLTIGPLLAPVGVLVVAACACSGPAPSVADGPPAAGSPY